MRMDPIPSKVVVPKYKPRRVSAHRDFPPGCGRNSRPITNLTCQETIPTEETAGPNNSVTTETAVNGVQENGTGACYKEVSANCQPEKGNDALDGIVKDTPTVENSSLGVDILDSLVENGTGACDEEGKSSSKEIPVSCQLENDIEAIDDKVETIPSIEKSPLEIDVLVSLVENGTGACDEEGKLSCKEISVNCQLENGNEAIDNKVETIPSIEKRPLEIDVLDSLVENVVASAAILPEVNVAPKVDHEAIVSVSVEGSGPSKEVITQTSTKQTVAMEEGDALESGPKANGVVQSQNLEAYVSPKKSVSSNDNDQKEIIPKGNYKRRTKSAHRDFPPFCGRNAPCPSEKDLRELHARNANDKETTKLKVEVKRSSEDINKVVLDENAETEGNKTVSLSKNQNQSGEIVLPSEDNSMKETMKSASSLTSSMKTIVQGVTTRESRDDSAGKLVKATVPASLAKERDSDLSKGNLGKRKSDEEMPRLKLKYKVVTDNDHGEGVTNVGGTWMWENMSKFNDLVEVSSNDGITSTSIVDDTTEHDHEEEEEEEGEKAIVHGLMAAPKCPWRNPTVVSASKVTRPDGKQTSTAKSIQMNYGAGTSAQKSKKKKLTSEKPAYHFKEELEGDQEPSSKKTSPCSSNSVPNQGDARNKVRETLRFFQATCRKLLQEEEAKPETSKTMRKRVDLVAADIIKEKKKEVNKDFHNVGSVPGVEVGDEFQYRVELALVGVHRLYQGGIDYMKRGGKIIATSIVASGGYADCLDNPDVLIYSGQGGITPGKKKEPEDQKLERGNLALFNSIAEKSEVRVIHGTKETTKSDVKTKLTTTYTYDGLYLVEKYWQEVGPHDKLVYKFELKRIPGQPTVAWKEVKQIKKFKVREGVCNDDISLGKEPFPICAVNTIDDEKPPSFTYITKMRYLDLHNLVPQRGCDCRGECVDHRKCSCVVKNGGEIPFNYNGAIVETKSLVYECGPSCKCSSSCPNRVSQHGMKIQLEIFKTPTRGWGVRSLTSISSGSFICEYIGELIEDKEAEKRLHNDEYLFDIGQNYTHSLQKEELDNNTKLPDVSEAREDGGYTIDAAKFGNIGRFINHSCSPNLYAQNVLYDHEDKRMPHIMLFAAENIPPLMELTYHYNYSMDSVYDSSGNIKKKNCYCGSVECTGRMY